MLDLIYRKFGKYTIEGHYVGKDTYTLMNKTILDIYENTKHQDIETIMQTWKKLVDDTNNTNEIQQIMQFSGLSEQSEDFNTDLVKNWFFAKCYDYVVRKCIEELLGGF